MARFLVVPLIAASLACCNPTIAQPPPTPQPTVPSLVLGPSAIPLCGPWKFQIGDSPIDPASHRPQWSDPAFNDSDWEVIDLTPPPGSYNPALGTSGFVPGWMKPGGEARAGYAWYRLRVALPITTSPTELALKMPAKFDDAYQVFVNGQQIGELGHFTRDGVKIYSNLPRAFVLPSNSTRGSITIAIRMWMDPSTMFHNPAAGGLHGPPVLGQAPVIAAMQLLAHQALLHYFASYAIEFVIILLAIVVTLVLSRLDRSEPAFPLLAITCLVILVYVSAFFIQATTSAVDRRITTAVINLMGALVPPLWIIFWASWLRLDAVPRLHRIVWPLAALMLASWTMLASPIFGRIVPISAGESLSNLSELLATILEALLLWVGYEGIRKHKPGAFMALPAILLIVVGHVGWLLKAVHIPAEFHPFGVLVRPYQLGTMLSLCMVTAQLVSRFYRNELERDLWRREMEQARQVQQMLIPDTLPTHSAFALQSEYRPAQEVGGDFFQIIPSPDGSLLVIIGDVSGKGLKAAMLVSMIVGSIRTLAEQTHDPHEILQGLSRRLCGRFNHQFATCLAIRVSAAGDCIAANAGHLAPYLNGREIALSGSVPLGLVEDSEPEQLSFALETGDRLVLVTDGIVEARDANQQLFGFDRTTELIQQNHSAAEIASAAQHFGQEDDISVISITRTSVLVPSPV